MEVAAENTSPEGAPQKATGGVLAVLATPLALLAKRLASWHMNCWRRVSGVSVACGVPAAGQQAAAEVARRRAFFTPAFERLVAIIRGKCK